MDNKALWTILSFVICLNLFQCVLSSRKNAQIANLKESLRQQQISILVDENYYQKVLGEYAALSVSSIIQTLETAGIKISKSAVNVLIPPYVCGVCLEQQCDILLKFLHDSDLLMSIICPDFRLKDMKAKFSGRLNVSFASYDDVKLTDDIINGTDGIIYFTTEHPSVFVTGKKYAEISELYLKNIAEYIIN